MERLYCQEDLVKVDKQRYNLKVIYITSLIFALVVIVGLTIYRALLPYNTNTEKVLNVIIVILAVIFVVYSFIFLSIPYARVSDYQKFLYNALNNEKIIVKATILEIRENEITTKYGVDYYYIDVLEWSNSRNDYIKRSILVDNEFKNLKINKSTIIDVETAGNMLTAYEILGE